MNYNIEQDQKNKVHQHYPVRLTKYMSKPRLNSFLETFQGYRRADIMVKRDRRGNLLAIFIKKQNRKRRKEDKDLLDQLRGELKMNLADYLLRRLAYKKEGISLLHSVGKFIII